MTDNTIYKLIIADDHKMFLDGLLSIITHESAYEVVFTANDGKDVKKYLSNNREEKIDLVITDIGMPEMDGVALNHYIKHEHPTIKTLVVSMLQEPLKTQELTHDGVDGYIPKNAKKAEFLLAIATILEGKTYFAESIKQAYTDSIFIKDQEVIISLNNREKEILRLIATEHTSPEIADKLCLSKYTIEGYRKSLISKLQVRNIAGLTKYAIKLGLVE